MDGLEERMIEVEKVAKGLSRLLGVSLMLWTSSRRSWRRLRTASERLGPFKLEKIVQIKLEQFVN